MNSFKDFNITYKPKSFTGSKIKPKKILGKEIIVHDYKIADSCYEGQKCLHLQITFEEQKRVVFLGSTYLQEMIQLVPEENFPFTTTIVEVDDRHEFT